MTPRTGSTLRIVVLGFIVRGPLGGLAWHHLQYVLGLARMGHDVVFLEDSDDYPSCYDPSTNSRGTDPGYGLRFTADAFARVGLADRWAYHDAHRETWHGPFAARAVEFCRSADVCLNLSGRNPLRPWSERVPVRVFVDTDPVFTQVRHLTDDEARARAARHTAFFTFAVSLPAGTSTVPDDGFRWRPTRQPVVLDAWPVTPGPAAGAFTSVMLWESYGAVEYGGQAYKLKSDSFLPYLDLPSRAGRALELALGSSAAPGTYLERLGWRILDPRVPTADPWTYQAYIQRSRAEFGIAKHAYVATRSGWFSERSAAYLASGRPVVVQDTGFTAWLPAGDGVLAFGTPEEALEAMAAVDARYTHHCEQARAVAEAHFDARGVLAALLDEATGAGADGATPAVEEVGA